MSKRKRRLGDRKDGRLLRDIDSMHLLMPMLYPGRCDNEAYMSERIDLTKTEAYIAKRNAEKPVFKFTVFHIIVVAILKVLTLRPKMNYFIANKNMYEHNDVSASFVIKKVFKDESSEGMAFIHAKPEDDIDSIREDLYRQITHVKKGGTDASSDAMDFFKKLPRFIVKFCLWIFRILDRLGLVPSSLIKTDPYYASVILSNVGSFKIKSGYHHLVNWGTTSVFCLIGEIKKRPFYDGEGNVDFRSSVDIGLTIDERLADGYYYSKSVRMLKFFIENPEYLERPLSENVEFDNIDKIVV